MKPKLIGIAGPSGAGKSTITRLIKQENSDFSRIKLDNYFNNIKGFKEIEDDRRWDIYGSIDFDGLYKNLADLKNNKSTLIPRFNPNTFSKTHQTLKPKTIILVEGLLLFFDKRIRDLFDLKIYLDISGEASIERYKIIDSSDKYKYMQDVVIPNYKVYGEPAKEYADHIIDSSKSIKEVKAEVLEIINQSFDD